MGVAGAAGSAGAVYVVDVYTGMVAGLSKLLTDNLSVPCMIKCIFGKTVRYAPET